MRLARLGFCLCTGIAGLLISGACRRNPAQPPTEIPAPHAVSNAIPTEDFARMAVEVHRAAQEMALDGFQFDRKDLGWPCEIGADSSLGYFEKMIRNGFLRAGSAGWTAASWKIANLSDADPGETAFLEITQPEGGILIVRKDGQWAVFRDEAASAAFAKAPPRNPSWLP